jgi:hypothetical protein
MARGIVLGQVFDDTGSALSEADVSLLNIFGADSQGTIIQFTVPTIKKDVGGWFKTSVSTQFRSTNSAGCFAIPFSWDMIDPDNLARVTGNDILKVKVIVFPPNGSNSKVFWGKAGTVPDFVTLLDWIKSGQLLMGGEMKPIFDALKPQFKDLIKGSEFKGIPFSMLSTGNTIAIVGILPNLQMSPP